MDEEMMKPWGFELEEYIREGEVNKAARADAWQTAIGLQAVDGLKPSQYLIETAQENIDGDISMEEAERRIESYYKARDKRTEKELETEEADIVSSRIAKILSERTFSLSPATWKSIHGQLFKGLSMHEVADHIARFTSGIWQIHPFSEGSTRSTAVFIIKYLNSLGYRVNNQPFAEHSWYFRNALVRANYNNLVEGVVADPQFLEAFFRNLLLGEDNELKNRFMHLDWVSEQENALASGDTEQVTEQVGRLLLALGDEELSAAELMQRLELKHRPTFMYSYLHPAIEAGLVEPTIPDKPNSRLQKYRKVLQ